MFRAADAPNPSNWGHLLKCLQRFSPCPFFFFFLTLSATFVLIITIKKMPLYPANKFSVTVHVSSVLGHHLSEERMHSMFVKVISHSSKKDLVV